MRFKMCTIGGIQYGSMETKKFADEKILQDLTNNAVSDFQSFLLIFFKNNF